MITRRAPLRSKSRLKRTPMRKRSKKSRELRDKVTGETRVIRGGSDYAEFRRKLAMDAGGVCQIPHEGKAIAFREDGGLDFYFPICGRSAPYYPDPGLMGGHVCHWPAKKMGNSQGSDVDAKEHNGRGVVWGCQSCHNELDNRGRKVVPKKEVAR